MIIVKESIKIFLLSMFLVQAEHNYTLPSDFPVITIETNQTNSSAGNLFLNSYVADPTNPVHYLFILNSEMDPIYFKKTKGITALDFKVQPNGFLSYIETKLNYQKIAYIMNSEYTVIDSFTSDNYWMDNHEFQLLTNGNAIFLARIFRTVDLSYIGGSPAAQVEDYIIQELDENKNVVFEWNTEDYFEITDAPHISLTSQKIYYVHANSIDIDSDGSILLSSRHLDEITKIDRNTGEIIWRLGGLNNQFTFINEINDSVHSGPFCYQHDVRRIQNGDITFFDNGNFKNAPYSRMVQYEIDEENLIANLVWSYSDSSNLYSPWMGNVQRLNNGNTIGSFNRLEETTSVIELSQDCTKVIHLNFENTYTETGQKNGIWNYRAFRHQWEGKAIKPSLWINNQNNSIVLNFVQFGDSSVTKYYIYYGSNLNTLNKIDSTVDNFYEIQLESLSYDTSFFRISSNYGQPGSIIESQLSNFEYVILNNMSNYSESNLLNNFSLSNFPNPFNAKTKLKYQLSENTHVRLIIYDIIGRVVKELLNQIQSSGSKSVIWDATNFQGAPVSTGIYICSIEAGDFRTTKKMVLLK